MIGPHIGISSKRYIWKFGSLDAWKVQCLLLKQGEYDNLMISFWVHIGYILTTDTNRSEIGI